MANNVVLLVSFLENMSLPTKPVGLLGLTKNKTENPAGFLNTSEMFYKKATLTPALKRCFREPRLLSLLGVDKLMERGVVQNLIGSGFANNSTGREVTIVFVVLVVDTRLNSVVLLMICIGVVGVEGELGRLLESTEANRTVSIFLRCSVSKVIEDVIVAVVPVGVKLVSCRGLERLFGKGGLADDLPLVLEVLRSFTVGVDGDI
uniref:Uncharacterized protein n=1 Tax=Glossina palpalis gambiensis TaxID=67801 RepID=A0A1B0BSC4_9MUSC